MTKHYTVQPIRYISHLIGHEGKGSILSLLVREGWANRLTAGSSSAGLGFEFFKITVDLTKEGLLHYEDIMAIIFQYILMLRQEGVKSYIWDEVKLRKAMILSFEGTSRFECAHIQTNVGCNRSHHWHRQPSDSRTWYLPPPM